MALKRKAENEKLNRQLTTLYKKLSMINLKANVITIIQKTNEKIDKIKKQLEKESQYLTQAAMLRSKVRWTQFGEKNTKMFLNLEKQNARAKLAKSTYDENGRITYDPKKIAHAQVTFFSKLYKSEESTIKFLYHPSVN